MKKGIDILKTLGSIFPKYVVLVAFLPLIVGLFVDIDLVNARLFIITLVWIAIFMVPSILTGKKTLERTPLVLFFIFGLFEISHWVVLRFPVNVVSLMAMVNTNARETTEFFESKSFIGLVVLIPYTWFFVKGWKAKSSKNVPLNKVVLYVVFAAAVVFVLENTVNNRLARKGSPHLVKTGISFVQTVKSYQNILGYAVTRPIATKNLNSDLNQTIVLILGESTNRNHMGLYGADRQTNPLLSARGDIYVYDDVVSTYSNTVSSVLRSLSNLNINDKDTVQSKADIFDVLNSSDFETYWISNQPPIGIWESWISSLAKKAKHTTFVNVTSSSSHEANNTASYDEKLFVPFGKALADSGRNKFIVLHLMGCHTSYAKRYPPEYERWSASGNEENAKAHYANSLLYNDFVVDSLLSMIENVATNNATAAIYLSDHGENVYDELGICGHYYAKVLPRSNVEIPYLVWLSPSFIAAKPEKSTLIKERIHTPYMTDDLFHTLQDFISIDNNQFDSTRSLFHSGYKADRIRLLENKTDYDKLP